MPQTATRVIDHRGLVGKKTCPPKKLRKEINFWTKHGYRLIHKETVLSGIGGSYGGITTLIFEKED
jgi:hypothetical protein